MASPFTAPSISGYNTNPPSDDGSQTEANRGKWATIVSKIGGPLKTYADALNSAVTTAFGKSAGGAGIVTTGITRSGAASDQGKLIVVTGSSTTQTTPDASSVNSPFAYQILNNSGGSITLAGYDTQTINGEDEITVPDGKGGWIETDGSNWFLAGRNFDASPELPRGYIAGLGTSNNSTDSAHDIDIAVGECRDSTDTINLFLTSALTKRIDASWEAGTGNGGMASAVSLTTGQSYHVFIVDDENGDFDVGFDSNISATNLLSDTGGTYFRRIVGVRTDGSSNIIGFFQQGDIFLWKAAQAVVSNTNPGTDAVTPALTVPTGVRVLAKFSYRIQNHSGSGSLPIYFTSPEQTDEQPSTTAAPMVNAGTDFDNSAITYGIAEILTNTSAQIRYHATASPTNSDIKIQTIGWTDRRGQDD